MQSIELQTLTCSVLITLTFQVKRHNKIALYIKPFYPRSERVLQERAAAEEIEQKRAFERGAYAEVVGRGGRPKHEAAVAPHADRVVRISERELLEKQRRMQHHGLVESYMNRPLGDDLARARVVEPVHAAGIFMLFFSESNPK